jgi:hypothetical protein
MLIYDKLVWRCVVLLRVSRCLVGVAYKAALHSGLQACHTLVFTGIGHPMVCSGCCVCCSSSCWRGRFVGLGFCWAGLSFAAGAVFVSMATGYGVQLCGP